MKKLLALVLVMAFALIAGGAVADHTDNILYSWTTSPKTQNPHMYTSTTSSTRLPHLGTFVRQLYLRMEPIWSSFRSMQRSCRPARMAV